MLAKYTYEKATMLWRQQDGSTNLHSVLLNFRYKDTSQKVQVKGHIEWDPLFRIPSILPTREDQAGSLETNDMKTLC